MKVIREANLISLQTREKLREHAAALSFPSLLERSRATPALSLPHLAAGEVGVLCQLDVEALKENLVGDFAHVHAGFVQNGEDAFMLLFHQVHNDLIVEVINLKKKARRRLNSPLLKHKIAR